MAQAQVPMTPEDKDKALVLIADKTAGSALAYFSRKSLYIILQIVFIVMALGLVIFAIAMPTEAVILNLVDGPVSAETANEVQKLTWKIKGSVFIGSLFPLGIAFLISILRKREQTLKEVKDLASGVKA